jgi:hypothetical protein
VKVFNINPGRCTYCGGSRPVTGRADRTGECACRPNQIMDAFHALQHAGDRELREKRSEIERKSRSAL